MENNNEKNLTVWQRLQRAMGPNALLNQDYPVYKFDKEQLLKTTSKQEFEKEKLEAQQTFYLSNQWSKIESNLYTQAVYYEPTRLASFYDFESMEYSIAGDTKIATPDGFITIKELSDKGRDYEFITYAYDHNLKKVVPAKARNAHYTRDEMTYKITFDDGSHIIATYGHRFLKRDGVFCEVENLKEGDSMMPFYRKSFYNNQNYHWVYSCNSNEGHHGWVSEHDLIAEWFYDKKIESDEEVHHIDFNGKNNLPENLKIMKISEHRAYHARLNNEKLWVNEEYRKKMSEVARRKGKMSWGGKRKGNNNPSYIEMSFDDLVETTKKHRTINETAKSLGVSVRKIQNELRFQGFRCWDDFLNFYGIKKYHMISENYELIDFRLIPWDLLVETARSEQTMVKVCKKLNITFGKLRSTIRQGGYNNWTTFMNAYGLEIGKTGRKKEVLNEEKIVNHKIVSIEPYGIVPVYDLTVPGYKNFATDTIFSHNTPEISAALDIYAEESTTSNQNGHMLQIYSESKRIKSILADLFNNTLDINTNLPMWIRNACKFGDNFVYLKLDPEKGVVGCMQLPNIEIERLERGMPAKSSRLEEPQEHKGLRFKWKTKDMEFNSWEIAHFRLLGDDRKLPYGTSMLEKARRIWKQLLLSEDAMLIYRTSRAPERRVFKVFVGNMDDKDVEPYVQRVANKFKRDQVVDSKTGNVDMRFNQMAVDQDYFIPVRDPNSPNPIDTLPGACIDLSTRIPLLDGRTLELRQIIDEWDNGNRNLWVYSCNPTTGEFVPGIITWAGVTRKNTNVMKITLDNGEEIIATPDHKFVHRTKGFVPTNELKVGDSLMPFYTKKTNYYKNSDYLQIFDNKLEKWVWVHKEVAKFHKGNLVNETTYQDEYKDMPHCTIHHINFKRFDNSPNNLTYMNSKDHIRLHYKNQHIAANAFSEKYKNNPNFAERVRKQLNENNKIFHNKRNSNPEYKELIRTKQKEGINKFFDSLSAEELKKWCERINNPITKEKATKKLLEWCKEPENLKLKGKLISAVKSTPEAKEKISKIFKSLWERPGYRESVFNKTQTLTFTDKLYDMFVNEFENHLRADITLDVLNNSTEFISEFITSNKEIRSSLTNLKKFTHNHLEKMIKQKGFKNFREWKQNEMIKRGFINIRQWKYYIDKENGKYGDKNKGKSISQFYNHKIVKIEYLEERIDTGTITVDGNEIYHNYHTFALESGVYIKNSNLGEIADIEYIQKKLLTSLRVPKAFLGFEEVVGDGKNLSLQDIRFARTINRIQKCMISELNKIAIIHLFLLGFEDELSNFMLGLTNPSKQADLLAVDVWKEKIQLYKEAVTAIEGVAPVSVSWAKKHILGFSDDEIKLDLQQQRIEKAVGSELTNTPTIITHTGIFDNVDKLYKQITGTTSPSSSTPPPSPGGESELGMSPEPGGEPGITPESKNKNNLNILLERESLLGEDSYIDLSKARNSLGEIENQLKNILRD